jgi:hypothetical protein
MSEDNFTPRVDNSSYIFGPCEDDWVPFNQMLIEDDNENSNVPPPVYDFDDDWIFILPIREQGNSL